MNVIFNRDWTHTINDKVAIALGSFDGIHKGHRQLIQSLNDIKKEKECLTMVYTFREHPMTIISPGDIPLRITNNEEKIDILRGLGIDFLVFNEFTSEFSKATPCQFVRKHLADKYNIDTIVIGYNFRFGARGEGDIETMIELGKDIGFDVKVIPPIRLYGDVISSSKIRRFIGDGDVSKAAEFLGYPYSLSGKVIRGRGRGRQLGFPTANLEYETTKVIPSHGVYLTLGLFEDVVMWGLTNIGTNPTFGQRDLCIETHLIGYSGNLYGKEMQIYFLEKIRDEIKFNSAEELVRQMNQDMDVAKKHIYKIIQMCYNTGSERSQTNSLV